MLSISYSQVYNYAPLSSNDIEINPSVIATQKTFRRNRFVQQNAFDASNNNSYTRIQTSKYFEKHFFGVGFSGSNLIFRGNRVTNFGVGAAYSNVLLNTLRVKIGAMYKLINIDGENGYYDYFSIVPNFNISSQKSHLKANLNASITFSLSQDKFFVTISRLNIGENVNRVSLAPTQFPEYYVLQIGNFLGFLHNSDNHFLGVTSIYKIAHPLTPDETVLYLNYHSRFQISRKSSLIFGSNIGYSNLSYIHIIPTLGLEFRKFDFNMYYNFHLNHSQPLFQPLLGINLNFTL